MAQQAKAVLDAYELVREALPVIGRFPRSHRFTLGDRLENRLLDVLERLEEARYGRRRGEALEEADVRLRSAGSLIRLACDLGFVSRGQYGALAERITGVGKQIGGWLKFVGKGGRRSGAS